MNWIECTKKKSASSQNRDMLRDRCIYLQAPYSPTRRLKSNQGDFLSKCFFCLFLKSKQSKIWHVYKGVLQSETRNYILSFFFTGTTVERWKLCWFMTLPNTWPVIMLAAGWRSCRTMHTAALSSCCWATKAIYATLGQCI